MTQNKNPGRFLLIIPEMSMASPLLFIYDFIGFATLYLSREIEPVQYDNLFYVCALR